MEKKLSSYQKQKLQIQELQNKYEKLEDLILDSLKDKNFKKLLCLAIEIKTKRDMSNLIWGGSATTVTYPNQFINGLKYNQK